MQLRLFAPVLPFATEEVWSWWQSGSVHRAAWPPARSWPSDGDPALVGVVAAALAAMRKAKSEAKVSMRADVSIRDGAHPAAASSLEAVRRDLVDAGLIASLTVEPGEGPVTVDVVLAEQSTD